MAEYFLLAFIKILLDFVCLFFLHKKVSFQKTTQLCSDLKLHECDTFSMIKCTINSILFALLIRHLDKLEHQSPNLLCAIVLFVNTFCSCLSKEF